MLSIDKISYKITDAVACSMKHIMMENINNRNIGSENPLCLNFDDVDGYIIEESNENKYLVFALTKNTKKVLGI